MELIADPGALREGGNLVAIGKWDGVHLAHQAVINALVQEARATGGRSVVMGFHPLPMQVLRPDAAPPLLQTLEERAEVLASMGVDVHLAIPFTPAFSAMPPDEFVRGFLVQRLRARQVMVGFNHTFGRGGTGTAQRLKSLCEEHGVPVRIFDPVRIDGENVSSSEIRLYVAEGRMDRVERLLGRPFAMTGSVISGDRRGRLIGYPTANIALPASRQLPATGVYAVRVTILGADSWSAASLPCQVAPRTGPVYGGMLNLGRRPTFQGSELRCEAHLFDFDGDLYGRQLQVAFVARLRSEQAFADVEALKVQIRADEAQARAHLNGHG